MMASLESDEEFHCETYIQEMHVPPRRRLQVPARRKETSDDAGSQEDEDEGDKSSGGGQVAEVAEVPSGAPAPPLGHREPQNDCAICWEQLPYLMEARGGESKSALLEKVQDFRRSIFSLEQQLRGGENDTIVFHCMLQLRRLLVENFLSDHGFRFRAWTMRMLREHYDPSVLKGHSFDYVRAMRKELEELEELKTWTTKHAMFVMNPDTEQVMFNVKAIDPRVRLSKQYMGTLKQLNDELRARSKEDTGRPRLIMETVNDAVNRLTGQKRKLMDADDDPLSDMYEIGGA